MLIPYINITEKHWITSVILLYMSWEKALFLTPFNDPMEKLRKEVTKMMVVISDLLNRLAVILIHFEIGWRCNLAICGRRKSRGWTESRNAEGEY